ncbi:MAG: GntR family transcriptional regulator [Candidatus Dormibacteria bacterium]
MPVLPADALDPGLPAPLYRQLAARLRQAIEQGRFGPGVQLPSERKLMVQYSVTRTTVRSALGALVADGLVTPEQGAGVFVRERPELSELDLGVGPRVPGERPFRLASEPSSDFHVEYADADIAAYLEVNPGRPVARWSGTVRSSEGAGMLAQVSVVRPEPVRRPAPSHLPAASSFLPGAMGVPPELERLGVIGYTDLIEARMPSPDEREALRVGQGVPVLQVTRQWRSQTGVEAAGTVVAAADRSRFRINQEQLPA